ncbi:Uncharacterised protein [Segatella copri]|nr:Uncharacterised protein [Segatella copri]
MKWSRTTCKSDRSLTLKGFCLIICIQQTLRKIQFLQFFIVLLNVLDVKLQFLHFMIN